MSDPIYLPPLVITPEEPEITAEQEKALITVNDAVDGAIAFVEDFTGFLKDHVDHYGQIKASEIKGYIAKNSSMVLKYTDDLKDAAKILAPLKLASTAVSTYKILDKAQEGSTEALMKIGKIATGTVVSTIASGIVLGMLVGASTPVMLAALGAGVLERGVRSCILHTSKTATKCQM